MIEQKDWKWYGYPGHFCGGSDCVFHLTTQVGEFVVSTVGEYRPTGESQAVIIGGGKLYETMVFRFDEICEDEDCSCGQPIIDLHEVLVLRGDTAKEGNTNHLDACIRVARGDI